MNCVLLRIPPYSNECRPEGAVGEKLPLSAGLEVERLPAHAKLDVPILEVEGGVRIPDGVVMRPRPSGGVGFETDMAAAVIRGADSELGGDEPMRAAAGIADGIARSVDNQVSLLVEDRAFRRVENGIDVGVLALPQRFQPKTPALHREGPRQIIKRNFAVLELVCCSQVRPG